MKIFFGAILALAASLATTNAQNPQECLTSVDSTVDYFPDKVVPVDSKLWTIEYANTYKILTNLAANQTYLLFQCGTEAPADQLDGRHTVVTEIPLTKVALTQTPPITYLEQLGVMEKISVFLSNPDGIASSCFKARVDAGEVTTLDDLSGTGTDFTAGNGAAVDVSDTLAFVSPFDSDLPFDKQVVISASREGPSQAIFEWVKFYSAFFNTEALANLVVEEATDRFECIGGNAALVRSDAVKPTVLWAYYSNFCGGWDIGDCDGTGNYYCGYADDCAADIITSSEGSLSLCGGFTYMTLEEVVELGKDADHWIYPAANWDTIFAANRTMLETMKSVQNEQVFDNQGSGNSGWFEQRLAEYYDLLDDFCTIVGTTTIFNREKSFLRNVFTEEVKTGGVCVDPSASLILNDDHECVPNQLTAPPEDSGSVSVNLFLSGVTLAFAALCM